MQARLALQSEMGIETPRLLSEQERDQIAGELQSLPPVERLARLGELKQQYGDRFDLLRQELGGDIDGATARLVLFADRPVIADLLAKGIGKVQRDGLAKSDGPLPPAVFIHADKDGPNRFDIGKLGKEYGIGQIFILPDGSRVLYDGEALVPTNADTPVTLAGADDPATPTPPIPLGKKGLEPKTPGGDAESEHVTLPSAPEEGDGGSAGRAGEQGHGGSDSAVPNEAPVDLETEHTSLPTGEEEDEGTLGHETNGDDEAPSENATEGPHNFHPGTEQRNKEQIPVATDRQHPSHDEVSPDQPESSPQSAPGTNSDTNEKRADRSHDLEHENSSPSVDNTKTETAIDWTPVRGFVTSKETFETNGPVKIELNSMTLGLDGMRYTVDWHPLDKNGKRQTIVRSQDYRPPEYGSNLILGVSSETIIEPPYDNPYGFEVTVSVPPQSSYNDNSAGPYLNIFKSK